MRTVQYLLLFLAVLVLFPESETRPELTRACLKWHVYGLACLKSPTLKGVKGPRARPSVFRFPKPKPRSARSLPEPSAIDSM